MKILMTDTEATATTVPMLVCKNEGVSDKEGGIKAASL